MKSSVVACAAGALLATGCGRGHGTRSVSATSPSASAVRSGSPSEQIRTVFRNVWAAVESGDWNRMLSYATPAEQRAMEADARGTGSASLLREIAPYHPSGVVSVDVHGKTATLVARESSGTTNSVAFVNLGDGWRLNGNP